MISKYFYKSLKALFRKWYGELSVQELTKNKKLVKVIERIERRFNQLATS